MTKNSYPLIELAKAFIGRKVLIIGDVMLDEYVWGKAKRISPEAPVPVVQVTRRSYAPGGAGNVAVNVARIGGTAILCGVVGEDDSAIHLRGALNEAGVQHAGILTLKDRPTTLKSRVVANAQQVVRVDTEENKSLSLQEELLLMEKVNSFLPEVDVCLLSDYAKGLITPHFAQEVIAAACRWGKPVLVDPKSADFTRYRGAKLVTPNILETAQAARCEIVLEEDLLRAAGLLLSLLEGGALLITRGEAGMSLFEPGEEIFHIPTVAQQVFDVTGAGDTAIAILALALASGATLREAAYLANAAAGIVVGKVGTASVMLDELVHHLDGVNTLNGF